MVFSLPGGVPAWWYPCLGTFLSGDIPAWWHPRVVGSLLVVSPPRGSQVMLAAGADGPGVPMSPQTSQGVQVRRFKTLSELIALYLQPNQGLVCTLLFPVEREKEKETVEDRDYSGMAG